MNLLEETNFVLKKHKKTFDNVIWVGTKDFEIPFVQFEQLANRDYDNGWGAQRVAEDLLVVGDTFWLERNEYDGSEWWEYKVFPQRPEAVKEISTLFPGSWTRLDSQFDD